MLVHEYTRRKGQRLTYIIVYDQGEYFIQRDNQMKKSVAGRPRRCHHAPRGHA